MCLPFQHRLIGRHAPIVPGSASWTSPGTYYLTVPKHRTMSFDVRGAGGGGGGPGGVYPYNNSVYGGTGGAGGYSQVYYNPNSSLLNAIGYGGTGGTGSSNGPSGGINGSDGSAGTASGGDGNYTGGGAGGGARGYTYYTSGGWPNGNAGYGGNGGRSVRTLNRDILIPGQTLVIIVGSGGAAGPNSANAVPEIIQVPAGAGSNGAVYISWT